MAGNIMIRKASKNEAEVIALLGRITFTETFGHLFINKNELLDYYENTFSVEKIRKAIQKRENTFWLAYLDDLPVGYSKLKRDSTNKFTNTHRVCQLQKIYVLADFISMKIGLKLQSELILEAKKSLFQEIWLSVLISNERAINFYKKNGFRKIGFHDFSIGSENFNFILMSKKI